MGVLSKTDKKILSKITNPIFFAQTIFGIKLSTQQKHFLKQVRKIIDAKIKKNIDKQKLTKIEKE